MNHIVRIGKKFVGRRVRSWSSSKCRTAALMALFSLPVCSEAVPFEDGDKVVLVGNTFMERAQHYGHLETALTVAAGKKELKFRNLAWSGDSVEGHARSYFGPPAEGFSRLKNDLSELKPNVVILGYGAVAAFEGEEGLDAFIQGYKKLIAMVKKTAKPRQLILMTPPPAETLAAPMPNMDVHNERLALYSKAIKELASSEKALFADLFTKVGTPQKGATLNGVHYTETGYQSLVPGFLAAFGMSVPANKLEGEQEEKLRETIVAKNKLFFHRWRPANETYLRLFRKHEQGQNVKELPMFDPLIKEKEEEIEKLRSKF